MHNSSHTGIGLSTADSLQLGQHGIGAPQATVAVVVVPACTQLISHRHWRQLDSHCSSVQHGIMLPQDSSCSVPACTQLISHRRYKPIHTRCSLRSDSGCSVPACTQLISHQALCVQNTLQLVLCSVPACRSHSHRH
jgi:hypothetical protein